MAEVIAVDRGSPEEGPIRKAVEVLEAGGLVAFPTDTVYGLGALLFHEDAVDRIFKVKGRGFDKPLPVLIADDTDLSSVTFAPPDEALALAKAFWPGPVTIVVLSAPEVPPAVTAGGDTVGVRLPDSVVARVLIEAAGTPLATTSANLSGGPSPLDAATVCESIGDEIDLVLDGGKTPLGLESTVVSLVGPTPVILREGPLSREVMDFLKEARRR